MDTRLQHQQRYNEYAGSSLPGAGFTKPWEEEEQEGRARVQAEDSTLDLSALQGAQANTNII